jgi:hypothetical protein
MIDSRRSTISNDVDAHVDEARTAGQGDFARGQRRDLGRGHGMRTLTPPVAIHHLTDAERGLAAAA